MGSVGTGVACLPAGKLWAISPLGRGERYEPVGFLLLEPMTVMVVMTPKTINKL